MSNIITKENAFFATPRCMYCGNLKEGEKYIPKTRNARPQDFHGKVLDAKPCKNCIEQMKLGVMICIVEDGQVDKEHPRRIGKFITVKQEFMERIKNDVDWNETRFCYMEKSIAVSFGLIKLS